MSANSGFVSGHVPTVSSRVKRSTSGSAAGQNLWLGVGVGAATESLSSRLNSRQNSTVSHIAKISSSKTDGANLSFIGKPGFLSPNFASSSSSTSGTSGNNGTGDLKAKTIQWGAKNVHTVKSQSMDVAKKRSILKSPSSPTINDAGYSFTLTSIPEVDPNGQEKTIGSDIFYNMKNNKSATGNKNLSPQLMSDSDEYYASCRSKSESSLSPVASGGPHGRQSASGKSLYSRQSSKTSTVYGHDTEVAALTCREWITILGICFANFVLGSAYALPAPFFPFEAELKNVPPSQYGPVYSTIEFGVFILSPIYGKLIPRISPRLLVSVGLIEAGLCEVTFGLLRSVPDDYFVVACVAVRALEALGAAAFYTSCYTLIAINFPTRVSTLFAYTEMSSGVGMICGPTLGGFLYEFGDFTTPFCTVGPCMIVGGFLLWATVKPVKEFGDERPTSLVSVFKNWNLILNLLISVNCFFLIGFGDSTLEPHIREFTDLNVSTIGMLFMIPGLVYTPTSHLWGKICDSSRDTYLYSAIGCAMGVVCYCFMGPLFPYPPQIWMIIVGQICIGIGMGGMLVPSFVQGLRETIANGFDGGISTYAVVAGLFSSAFSFGSTIGPTAGGLMVEYIGYRYSTAILVVIESCMVVIILAHKWIISRPGRTPHSINLSSAQSVDSFDTEEYESDAFSRTSSSSMEHKATESSSEADISMAPLSHHNTPSLTYSDTSSGLWADRVAKCHRVNLISYRTKPIAEWDYIKHIKNGTGETDCVASNIRQVSVIQLA